MTALTRYFFDTVYYPRNAWSVVGWWESRRPAYNAVVGGAGLVTLLFLGALGMLPPLRALAILVPTYAFGANLFYTLGWVADLVARRIGGAEWAPIGPTLFRYGFVSSVVLTLLPIPATLVIGALHFAGLIP